MPKWASAGAGGAAFVLRVLGVPLQATQGASPEALVGGLVTAGLGMGLTVWQIRTGVKRWFVLLLVGMAAAGIASAFWTTNLAAAMVGGLGTNGLMTLGCWLLFTGFLRLKARGVLPDEMLHFAFCWLVLTALMPAWASSQWATVGWVAAGLVVGSAVLVALLRRERRRLPERAPLRLLLLRVFGQAPLRNRLLDLLEDSWRRVGSVDLVVGADLAVRTVSELALEGFLLGRIDAQYLDSIAEADDRIAVLSQRRAFDGRYPVNELHCSPDVWQHAVTALARTAHVVLMDLRGFQTANRGVVLELRLVVERVPFDRVVLLTDRNTDERSLADLVQRAWERLPDDSPNAGLRGPEVDVVRCAGRQSMQGRAIVNAVFRAAERAPSRAK